jgi:alpha-galactosidase
VSTATLEVLGNAALLAVNQDALGKAAVRVSNTTTTQVWAGPLNGDQAVVILLNVGEESSTVTAPWGLIEAALPTCNVFVATDMWSNTTTTYTRSGGAPKAVLVPHEAAALRFACRHPQQKHRD